MVGSNRTYRRIQLLRTKRDVEGLLKFSISKSPTVRMWVVYSMLENENVEGLKVFMRDPDRSVLTEVVLALSLLDQVDLIQEMLGQNPHTDALIADILSGRLCD